MVLVLVAIHAPILAYFNSGSSDGVGVMVGFLHVCPAWRRPSGNWANVCYLGLSSTRLTRGLDTFNGEFIHSSKYDNGLKYRGKDVLVVGSGNSGMEIAYDLSNYGANTSIVIRSLEHNGQAPIVDVGSIEKIKRGEIKVLPSITSIKGKEIQFENGYQKCYDAIIFATGYKSTVLKCGSSDNGMPKRSFPNHWKSENGLYCAGFSRRGLFGISHDTQKIANDISFSLSQNKKGI
ncbi:hypothetical protein ACLB2K_011330 [Fragaria x ananassa]